MKKQKYMNLFLLVSFIIVIIMSPDNLILSCGIFAYIGNNPKKHFNWDKFNILGVFNDSRGGDACGLITNDYYQTLTKTGLVHYKDAIIDGDIKPPFPPINHAIGHTRKASSGGYKAEYTQPYIINKNHSLNKSKITKDKTYKKWSTSLPSHSILFSGVHNGTIYNKEELAAKYNIKITGQNDTQVLFDILFKKEYKVLEEYIGTASLVWHDYYENCTYVFRGESSLYTQTTNYMTEERPLFQWSVDNSNTYISSIKNSLLFIGAELDEVNEVPANAIFKIKDGKLIETIKINREKASQKEEYKSTSNNTGYHDNPNWNSAWNRGTKHKNSKSYYSPNAAVHVPKQHEDTYGYQDKDNISTSLRYMIVDYNNSSYQSKLRLSLETNPLFYHKHREHTITYIKGRYWVGDNLAHGIYALDPFGKLAHVTTIYQNEFSFIKLYYFVEGFHIPHISDYFLTKKLCDTYVKNMKNVSSAEVAAYEGELMINVAPFSKTPFSSLIDYTLDGWGGMVYKAFIRMDKEKMLSTDIRPFNGDIQANFAKRIYQIDEGDLVGIKNQQPALTTHTVDSHTITMEYVRNQSKLFTAHNTGDEKYQMDIYDKVGLSYYHNKEFFHSSEYKASFLSRVLNRDISVFDCNTLYPHSQQQKIGFATDNHSKNAIKSVATALLVHFKTFKGSRLKCINCKSKEDIVEPCFRCFKERSYLLNVVLK